MEETARCRANRIIVQCTERALWLRSCKMLKLCFKPENDTSPGDGAIFFFLRSKFNLAAQVCLKTLIYFCQTLLFRDLKYFLGEKKDLTSQTGQVARNWPKRNNPHQVAHAAAFNRISFTENVLILARCFPRQTRVCRQQSTTKMCRVTWTLKSFASARRRM